MKPNLFIKTNNTKPAQRFQIIYKQNFHKNIRFYKTKNAPIVSLLNQIYTFGYK